MILNKIKLRSNIISNRLLKTDKEKTDASLNIIKQLSNNKHFMDANYIGIYYPIKYEINITKLIKIYPNKKFAFPKIVDKKMFFVLYDNNTKFIKTKYGVNEPDNDLDVSHKIELFLVPAIGMTTNNYRLGHGAGYYDKFFNIYHNNYKIGIIYKDEEVSFEIEEHDIPLNTYLKG